jgi:hypothetical protein
MTFYFLKMVYNKYYNTQWVEILMTSFGYPKHKKKTLEFAWQHFGIQSSF